MRQKIYRVRQNCAVEGCKNCDPDGLEIAAPDRGAALRCYLFEALGADAPIPITALSPFERPDGAFGFELSVPPFLVEDTGRTVEIPRSIEPVVSAGFSFAVARLADLERTGELYGIASKSDMERAVHEQIHVDAVRH